MTQRDITGEARKNIPGNGRCRKQQGKDRHSRHRRIRKHLWERDKCHYQNNKSDYSACSHCFLPSACPNSPCGRITRITTSKKKNTVFAHTGDHTTAVTSSITSIPNDAISAPRKLPMPARIIITSKREIRSNKLLGLKADVAP